MLVLRRGGELGWVVGYSLEGESWDGEEEGEIEEERVGDSAGDCATSLYGDPSLNPSVIPSVKSSKTNPRHHTVATLQKNYIIRRRYGLYIPTEYVRRYILTVSPTGTVCRYIPTEVEMELFPSVKITDEKIPLVFADFLVVNPQYNESS